MTPIPNDFRVVLALGVLGIVAYYIVTRDIVAGLKGAASAVGTAVNPLDERNLANRAVTAVGETLSGSKPGEWSLGSWIYDVFNKPYDPNAAATPRTRIVAAQLSPVQPVNKPTVYIYR